MKKWLLLSMATGLTVFFLLHGGKSGIKLFDIDQIKAVFNRDHIQEAEVIHALHLEASELSHFRSLLLAERTLPVEDKVDDQEITEDGWQLIWKDDFSGRWLNPNRWNVEFFNAEKNNELQYYIPENVIVEDGLLKLISKKESYGGKDFTSGAVQTKDKFSFKYGKVEMKAKLPGGQGIFPAFWMMPNFDNTWLPEIDIMEMLGHKPGEIWMVVHWLDDEGKLKNDFSKYVGEDYTKDFHTYGVEWTPDSITYFIDGIERFRTEKFVPNMEMYLYINTAIGGDWPGSPDHTTLFPQSFEVDYVKVYQQSKGES
jgi:beta-glucanase (GH16 family)